MLLAVPLPEDPAASLQHSSLHAQVLTRPADCTGCCRIRMEMGATDSKRRHARIAALVANRKPSLKGGKMAQNAAAASPLIAAGNRASTPSQGNREEGGGASSSSSSPTSAGV
jgi:hypothetical protein